MARLEINIGRHFPAPANSEEGRGFRLKVALLCEPGITVLFGASGAGKTLTLDALAGFYKPDEGRIVLNDAILFDAASGVCLPTQRRGVGYVFQHYALFPHLSIEQNLAFGIQHLPPVERGRRIHEQLSRFGLLSKRNGLPRELSGGEKQRASIARALIYEPRLLLLDEPVRGLDYPLRADFYEILRQVRKEHSIPILLVTHDANEAYLLADRIAVLEDGAVIQHGEPEDVFNKPASPSIARLLGIENVFSAVIDSLDPMSGTTRVRAEGFALTLPYLPGRLRGDHLEFCIHKEGLRLHPRSSADAGKENAFAASIVSEALSPRHVRLALALDSPPAKATAGPPVVLETELSRQAYQSLQLEKSAPVCVEIAPEAVHVFPPAAVS